MRFIGNFFPKDHHKIMFDSGPSFSDNSRALFEYIYSKDHGNINRFIWIVDEGSLRDIVTRFLLQGQDFLKKVTYYI